MTAAIEVHELVKTYGAVHALDGLNLTVEPGSVFGFLGPNGAGKTTTLRILTGLARPTQGTVRICGEPVGDGVHRVSPRVGYLPEEPAFYNWMTPEEFLDLVGQIFGLTAADRKTRTRELLAQVDLDDVRKRRIGGFSRGMRQRLGLAQALVNHPTVLLLDEPASALDPAGRRDVLELIERLKGESTVLISTHILSDVERVCDTVAILSHGKTVAEGNREELMARYAVPAYEVDVNNGSAEHLADWADQLRRLPWVKMVQVNGSAARILVNDVDACRQEMLAAAAESGLAINRLEVVHPSLEDVFLQLVDQKEGAA
jgi:ABC-2 type transport system ATP-binding protein